MLDMSDERALSCPHPAVEKIASTHQTCAIEEQVSSGSIEEKDEEIEVLLAKCTEERTAKEEFSIGQSYFDKGAFDDARTSFERCCETSMGAKYQLAVMLYDGLGGPKDCKRAVALIKGVIEEAENSHIGACALYNLGRAYYEGFGIPQSDDKAEANWIKASRVGKDDGCVKAQSVLGMYYSRIGEESYDLEKSHYWHQEATGNGSLESHGALGVMYEHGLGVVKDLNTSFRCFKSAAERGNIYAMGNLAVHYYRQKLFINAADVAKRAAMLQDTETLSRDTDCLEAFIKKGVALGCFIYGRCVHLGLAVEKSANEAEKWYTRAAEFDLEVTAKMQELMTFGYI